MESDELVHEAGKVRRQGYKRGLHTITVTPWLKDSWKGEQAEQTLSELDNLVNGYGNRSNKHQLFRPHPRYRYELQENRNKGDYLFLLVYLCLLGLLALELARRHMLS